MALNIISITGEQFLVEIKPFDTITNVKKVIEERAGYPWETMHLIYRGEELQDEKTCGEYNFYVGAVVKLIITYGSHL